MKSHQLLRQVIQPHGVKKIAHELRVSNSLIYKWCEEDSEDGSGARNPLDRLLKLVESTQDREPIEWLCSRTGGTYVPNPVVDLEGYDAEYIAHTQQLLDNFSQLLRTVSQAMSDDGRVDQEEAGTIRREWDRLKGASEAFVQACELGMFAQPKEDDCPEEKAAKKAEKKSK
ncbi:MAG: hypothetical protein JKY65_19230 [Planctomycetes bacterium]|nr:hypothetical protein [Planctomycetota bacterium]